MSTASTKQRQQEAEESLAISIDFQGANPSHRIEMVEMDIDDLSVDPTIQRGIEAGEVKKIVDNFNPAALGTFTASARTGGVYSLLDGQQRRAALLRLREAGLWPEGSKIQVIVHYGLSHKEEAQLFLDLNFRRSVAPLKRFKTRLVAGESQALAIKGVLDSLGISLTNPPKGFNAVITADRILAQENGLERFTWAINMVKRIYDDGQGGCYDGRVIEAFAMVKAAFGQHIDDDRLVSKLQSVGDHVSKLLGAGRTRKSVNGGMNLEWHIAEAIIRYYNESKRNDVRYPTRLPSMPRRRVITVVDVSEVQQAQRAPRKPSTPQPEAGEVLESV